MLGQTKNIAITNFFGALHYFLTIYIVSPHLAEFMGESAIGLVFAAGALLSLLGFVLLPQILKKIPLKRVAQILTVIQIGVLTALALSNSILIVVIAVILLSAIPALIGYSLDVFLEQATEGEDNTGSSRGFFIAVGNIALVISPLAVGYILGDTNEYGKIFALAAATLFPFLVLLSTIIHAKDVPKKLETLSLRRTLRCLMHSKDVMLGASAHLVMLLFFSWVGIYIPLYLHTELGIAWESLGWVFSVMLLPYLLLEFPIGIAADKWFGEREIMMGGFAIMGIALALVGFISIPLVTVFLVAVLISTRIGGAMVEITTETYFFKHVDGSDINSISLFRMLRPLGALIGPLIGSFVLLFISLQSAFIVLGAICLLGIPLAFFIKDTR